MASIDQLDDEQNQKAIIIEPLHDDIMDHARRLLDDNRHPIVMIGDDISEEHIELAKMSLAGTHNVIIAGGRNVGRAEAIRKAFGIIGHAAHGSTMITSQKFKDDFEKLADESTIDNIDVKNLLHDRYLGTIDESITYKLHNIYEEILQHDDYSDPLRKKYRKQNNAQHKGSKKKNKQAKQARKKNRKK